MHRKGKRGMRNFLRQNKNVLTSNILMSLIFFNVILSYSFLYRPAI